MDTPPKPHRFKKPPVRTSKPKSRPSPKPLVAKSPVAPVPEAPAGKITSGEGYGIRLAARILDTFYVTFLGFFSGIFGGIILVIFQAMGLVQADWGEKLKGFNWSILLWSLLAVLLYHWAAECIGGTSMGKLICQLRVLQQDGRPCTMKGAFIRNLGYYIDGIFFGLVGLNSMNKSPLQQRYGDVWGKTVVVKALEVPVESKPSGLYLFLGIAVGSAFNILCLVIALILRAL